MPRRSLIALAAFVAACVLAGPAAGQAVSREPQPQGQEAPPPVLSLLGFRERLSLTSEQIAALDSIAHEWDVENERLTTRGTMVSSGLGGTSISRARTTRPANPEAEANNLRAARAVEALLTEEQRRLVCEMRRSRAPSPWPWCSAGR